MDKISSFQFWQSLNARTPHPSVYYFNVGSFLLSNKYNQRRQLKQMAIINTVQAKPGWGAVPAATTTATAADAYK